MTTRVIQLHEALDGSTHATLKECEQHNRVLKSNAFVDLVTLIGDGMYLFDEQGEQNGDLAQHIIKHKHKFITLLDLL